MANLNYNKVTLAGRLTADVELKTTESGLSVCSFSLAIARAAKKDETDFIDCVAWRQTAEFISKYFKKGSSLMIEGSLQKRNWTDNNGNKRYSTEVIADKAYFVDSKNEVGAAQDKTYVPDAYTPNFEEVKDGDDLPF